MYKWQFVLYVLSAYAFIITLVSFYTLSPYYGRKSVLPSFTYLKYTSAFEHAPQPSSDASLVENWIQVSGHDKKKVLLFLAVVTAPVRIDRRTAIRQTWLSTLSSYPDSAMRFFTDGLELTQHMSRTLRDERVKYGDVEFMPLKGGVFLTHRLLWSMFWAYENYDFEFFLKTDDDYFICLNHLNYDLQRRKQEKDLYWGWFHCEGNSLTWMDEGFLILSHNVVHKIVERNNSLMCSPFGDQSMALWITEIEKQNAENITWFADNTRLIHRLEDLSESTNNNNICSNFLGIHQAYPKLMYQYWNLAKASWFNSTGFRNVDIKPFSDYCSHGKGLNWQLFMGGWKYKPQPCWTANLSWPELEKNKFFVGREGTTPTKVNSVT